MSNSNAMKMAIGGTIAPMRIEKKKTFDIRLAISKAVEAWRIKKAKVKTSPTNRVVREIPIPTIR